MLALRNRDFRLLWTGQLLSALGDWFLVLAVPVHVYRVTGSVAVTGLVYAATNVPAVVVGPIAGVFVDRWDRRVTMAATDAGRAVLLVGMTFGSTSALVAGVVLERVLGQLYDPASAALVPNVVGTGDHLASANAATSASSAVVRLVGAPVGGALLAAFGLRLVLLLDAASFAISLAAVLAIRWRALDHAPSAPRRVGRELRDGLGHVRRTPLVRWVATWMAAFLFCNGAVAGMLVPFVVDRLGGGSGDVGLVFSGLGAGYLVGAVLCARVARVLAPVDAVVGAIAVIGVGFIVLFSASSLAVALVGVFVAGVGGSVAIVTATTTVQRATPDALRGRVVAAVAAMQQAAQVAGTAIGALVVRSLVLWSVAVLAVAVAARYDALRRPFATTRPTESVL